MYVPVKYITYSSLYLSFVTATFLNFRNSLNSANDSWAMSDLLINYQGGLVRRGLFGEIAFRFGALTNIPINLIAVLASVLSFMLCVFYFFRNRGFVPIPLLVSPVFLGSAAYGGFIVRKDFFTICLVMFLCITLRRESTVSLLLANLIILVGALNHEAFIFLSVACIVAIRSNEGVGDFSCWRREILKWPMIPFASVLILLIKGDSLTAQKINTSLLPTWERISGQGCCDTPLATIESLGWPASQSLELTLSIYSSFSHGVWVPLGWIGSFTLSYFAVKLLISKSLFVAWRKFFYITLITFTPIMVIGWDFGRWGFLIFVTSLVLLCEFNRRARMPGLSTKEIGNKTSVLLFASMPICCWTVEIAVGSTPIGWFWFNVLKPLIF